MMRRFLLSAALGLACLLGSGRADAQDYPSRAITLVVPFGAGGPTDILARLIGDYLSKQLGQPVVVENRPGAGGNVGTQAVINSAPDGYTLLVVSHTNAINATLYRNMKFDFLKQITPVAGIAHVPNVIEVTPSLPVKTLADLIAYAKKNPGKLNFASTGHGTSAHLAGEMFKSMAGIDIVHVPYRGSAPALADLIGGQVQLMFDSMPASLPHIQAGKLRALAVTSAKRVDVLPDVPTAAETVPEFIVGGWFGIGVPSGTPQPIVERLAKTINAGFNEAAIKTRLSSLSAIPHMITDGDYRRFIELETERWGRVVNSSGAKVE